MKKKALVVDDNGSNLILEKDLLEVADFEVFVVEKCCRRDCHCQERKAGYYSYGCAVAGYAWFRSRNDIASRQRDPRYSHNFCNRIGDGRRQRRDKKHH